MSQDLRDFLAAQPGVVLVALLVGDDPASLACDQALAELESGQARVQVLRLSFPDYRDWARAQGVPGHPAILLFRDGRREQVLLGRIAADELRPLLGGDGVA